MTFTNLQGSLYKKLYSRGADWGETSSSFHFILVPHLLLLYTDWISCSSPQYPMTCSHFADCSILLSQHLSLCLIPFTCSSSDKQLHYSTWERESQREHQALWVNPSPSSTNQRAALSLSLCPGWAEEPSFKLYWGADDYACRRATLQHPLHLNHTGLARKHTHSHIYAHMHTQTSSMHVTLSLAFSD